MTARELKGDLRAPLTRDGAQVGDAELLEWLSMRGMTDPSQTQTNLYVDARGSEGAPDPQGASAEAEDHHRRPDPEVLLINAYRIYRARRALIAQGTITVNEIATAQRCHPSTARRRLQRACKRHELFTVRINGRIHVPAVLLDHRRQARPEWQPVIAALTQARLSDWAKWRWIARPNAGLSGEIAAEVINTDPERVRTAALRRVAQSTE